jgi:hypothetical protein
VFAPLAPRFTLDALHPRDTAFFPRSTLARTHWIHVPAWRLDALTGLTLSCIGSMPLVCHERVASEPALAFLEAAGLARPKSLLLYRDEAGALARARACVAASRKLAYGYPPPPGADADEMLLVPLGLYAAWNNKARLAEFVPPQHVPPRRFVAAERIADLLSQWPGRPVFVKAAVDGANGAGRGVRHCTSAAEWESALAWLAQERAQLAGIVVEDALPFTATWCASFALLAERSLYLGAAEQLFASVGSQSGSRIDPRNAPPPQAVAACLAVAEAARARGYRGLCGFDVGALADGRVFVVDLNFRINASTPQVLLHEPATRRLGAAVSQSFLLAPKGPLAAALERLRAYAEDGRLVPLRIYDAAGEPAPDATNLVSGIVIANDADGASALAAELAARLA